MLQARQPAAPYRKLLLTLRKQDARHVFKAAAKFFSADSACGPDGIWPQHTLVKNRDAGPALDTLLIIVVNVLLNHRCFDTIIHIFVLIALEMCGILRFIYTECISFLDGEDNSL